MSMYEGTTTRWTVLYIFIIVAQYTQTNLKVVGWRHCNTLNVVLKRNSELELKITESESYVTTDGQSASLSWYKAPIRGLRPDFFCVRNTEYVWQLRSRFPGAPSLTRGRVCLLYVPLALANAVFLGSWSLGTCDRILLSQIWDFTFRRLLRLAGSRWRYSTPPPYGCKNSHSMYLLI
jgi:hypothetical protein